MRLDCTQDTVLHHSLDMHRSALERYLNTAAGWLMLFWHHPIRRLRTALLEGGCSRTHLACSLGCRNLARMPARCVFAQAPFSRLYVLPALKRVAERSTSPHLATDLFCTMARPEMGRQIVTARHLHVSALKVAAYLSLKSS